jgi:LuxR family transcriptional regulator, regulator of acetate metabolism
VRTDWPATIGPAGLMRPDDRDAIRQALRMLHRRIGADMLFGGEVVDGRLFLTEFIGARTDGLRELRLTSGEGLGGRVVQQARVIGISDYLRTDSITHEHDNLIAGERLRAMLAVPYVVGRAVRGVIYSAVRSSVALGDRSADIMIDSARALGREVTSRDEVDRRLRLMLGAGALAHGARSDPNMLAELRELQGDLRLIAHDVADAAVRDRLLRALARLVAMNGPNQQSTASARDILSPREVDVLGQVALGCRNREIAQRLSIGEETVRSYLRNAAGKLGTHSRQQSVLAARRLGLLA